MVRRYGIDTHRISQANLPHKDGCLTPSLARLEVAVALYRDGKASMGKAAGIAGVPRMQFQQELCSRGVAVNYDVEEYERDLSSIRKLLPS